MTALTIAALVVIPAGIAFLTWLWVSAGRDYREVRREQKGAYQFFLEHQPPRLWETPDPAEVREYIERGNEYVRRAMEEES